MAAPMQILKINLKFLEEREKAILQKRRHLNDQAGLVLFYTVGKTGPLHRRTPSPVLYR